MLTTTLLPTVEEYFMKKIWMKADDIYIFRSRTTRSNIRYQIYRMQNRTVRAQEAELLEYIYQARAELYGGDKMVIYNNRVEDCKSLAESIGCEAYFHHADDTQGIFQRFAREKRYNIIVATSAFGMGIDVAHIRCVMYVNEPRTLFDYSQESSRAGRDEQNSRVVVIRGRMKGLIHEAFDINVDRALVQQYFEASCKRVVLDAYLNGRKDRERCEEGEEACERCHINIVEKEEAGDLITVLSSVNQASIKINHSPMSLNPLLSIRKGPSVQITPIRKSIVV